MAGELPLDLDFTAQPEATDAEVGYLIERPTENDDGEADTEYQVEELHVAANGVAIVNEDRSSHQEASKNSSNIMRGKANEENKVQEGLSFLISDMEKHPEKYRLLTADEEVDLAKQIERGDLEAKEQMIHSNIRLVISLAKKKQGKGLSMNELTQEGIFGLVRAVELFDYRKGFKFSTYATNWIRKSLNIGIAKRAKLIKLPQRVDESINKMERLKSDTTASLGYEPTTDDLAVMLDISTDEVEEMNYYLDITNTASLDKPFVEGDSSEFSLIDIIPSEGKADLVVEEAHRNEVKELLGEALEDLSERDIDILFLNFVDEIDIQEIAKMFYISIEEVAGILAQGEKLLINSEAIQGLAEVFTLA
jgi:RNA polymerase primary sigma factor